ncbi:MAG TPA: hypothetical protein VD887_07165 [Allosphingosinicella sp.]|nr:hypothetical protein [Allosphingosinicella sp.]
MRRLIVLFLGLCIAAEASAQVLWQNVRYGMTPEEVQAAQPGARRPDRPPTLFRGAAVCELQIPGYEVDRLQFDVCFFIQNGRLIQVMMTATQPSEAAFRSMSELLQARYGAAMADAGEPCRRVGSLRICERDWLLENGTNVGILYIDVMGRAPVLNINYQVRLRDESRRL